MAVDTSTRGMSGESEGCITDSLRNGSGQGQLRFIDLFAGLGGFHLALRNLGHRCVFASEIDETLRATYLENFGMTPYGDIRDVEVENIPSHDILCAGFPCQPFSKARDYSEPGDPELSELYLQILRVIRHHHPKFLILENVPNFEKHEDGQTWEKVKDLLRREGYSVRHTKLSPHEFDIPQIRQRIYIVGSRSPLGKFQWPEKSKTKVSIDSVLDSCPDDARQLPERVDLCLDIWQEFLGRVPKGEKVPHPLWSMEFGATYSYEHTTPWLTDIETLRGQRGSHGKSLRQAETKEEMLALLPSHARAEQERFPGWKVAFIKRNREFYTRHRNWLDGWMEKIKEFPSSFQKLEWNCQETDPRKEVRRIRDYVIQIRASGVRVKRKTTAPSLVAMTSTQVPIIGWEGRYMTPLECKRLQSMEELELPARNTRAYAALGNAINVKVAQLVAKALLAIEGTNSARRQGKANWDAELGELALERASSADRLPVASKEPA